MDEKRGRLVVQRRRGERVIIGEGPDRIVIESLGEARARLAIEAPVSVPVMREEIVSPERAR